MAIGGNYAYQLCRTNTYDGYKTYSALCTGGFTKYIPTYRKDKKFIVANKDAPVEFSHHDHYIRMFVDGKWHTINGIGREDYNKLITEGY